MTLAFAPCHFLCKFWMSVQGVDVKTVDFLSITSWVYGFGMRQHVAVMKFKLKYGRLGRNWLNDLWLCWRQSTSSFISVQDDRLAETEKWTWEDSWEFKTPFAHWWIACKWSPESICLVLFTASEIIYTFLNWEFCYCLLGQHSSFGKWLRFSSITEE